MDDNHTGHAHAYLRREQVNAAMGLWGADGSTWKTSGRLSAPNADYYKDVLLPLRQHILDETQLQFNAMIVGVFQLLQAKRDQIETARAYVEALREYWTARAEVSQLMAGRLPMGAESAEEPQGGAPTSARGSAE